MASSDTPKPYRFLHTALRVFDIDKSAAFYSDVFDMEILYRREMEIATLVFLGVTDPASPSPLNSREGVLELLAPKTRTQAAQQTAINSFKLPDFVKMAFNVPDLPATVEKIKRHDVEIVKELGVSDFPEALASFTGCSLSDLNADQEMRDALAPVCFIRDPNGYLIEIVQT